jgi:NADPH-dependent 2,4-dienoyl-CoA reductase/sulfur reductase-like enzyme
MKRIVVVGASLAGLRTAEALRRSGFTGALTIVGAEPHPPYNRPPLTKGALREGPDVSALALPASVELDATWALGVSVIRLDRVEREVLLETGEALAFDGLVIATGASARRLPDTLGGNGAHHIRTLDDATTLHRALAEPGRAVLVIGAGFLGSEVASTAASLGHRVTLVEATAGPMLSALGPEVSAYCAQLHRTRGVDLHTRTTVLSLTPAIDQPGSSVAVLVDQRSGAKTRTKADVVVAALGASPNTDWLRGSGIDIDCGIATNPSLTVLDTAGVPVAGIVAVGDVARVPQPLLDGAATRVEHWATAVGHSGIAAATLLTGQADHPAVLPSFWTDQHGTQIRGLGLPGRADTTTVVVGAMEEDRFVVTRSRAGRLVGVVAVNNSPALFRYRSELESAATTSLPTTRGPLS